MNNTSALFDVFGDDDDDADIPMMPTHHISLLSSSSTSAAAAAADSSLISSHEDINQDNGKTDFVLSFFSPFLNDSHFN